MSEHTKTILIVGGSGFVGSHLAMRLRDDYKVFATYHTHPIDIPGVTFIPMDLTKRDWVKRLVYTCQPEAVIYAAGSNSVEEAEASARNADIQHTSGAGSVSTLSEIFQPRFVYLSNAYVFDGNRGNYHETDIVLPPNGLGKAKLGGENFIRSKAYNYNIIRSSPLFGRGNGRTLTFLDRLRLSLSRGQRIELSDDELHSFVAIDQLVQMVRTVLAGGPRNRVLHCSGLTKLTPASFGKLFANRFGFDASLITPSTRGGSKLDFSLNSTATAQALEFKPLLLEQGFDLIEKQLIARP